MTTAIAEADSTTDSTTADASTVEPTAENTATVTTPEPAEQPANAEQLHLVTTEEAAEPPAPRSRRKPRKSAPTRKSEAEPTAETEQTAEAGSDAGGITDALTTETPAPAEAAAPAGSAPFEVDPAEVAPHPYNAPARSLPQPGNPKWDELFAGVQVHGVQVPAKVVTLAAFLAVRPELADEINESNENARYVAIYGHRRRAAAIEASKKLPVIIDDAIMANGGDLDAIAQENNGRDDYTELEEARLIARFLETGISQRKLAPRLSRDQATISRRVALLRLIPEIQQRVEDKKFPADAAAVIGGQLGSKLPWEPNNKKWKSLTDDQRQADQVEAVQLMHRANKTATAACEWVIAARQSREQAATEGIKIIDPRETFGNTYYDHRLSQPDDVEAAREAGTLFGALDANSGTLVYFTSTKPKRTPTGQDDAEKAEAKARADAMKARREACVQLIANPLPQKALLDLFARQFVTRVTKQAGSNDAVTLAKKWWDAGKVNPNLGDEWADYMANRAETKLQHHGAWALAVAAMELRACTYADWDAEDIAYLQLLTDRAKYKPTQWEQARLAKAAENAAKAAATDDADEDTDDGDQDGDQNAGQNAGQDGDEGTSQDGESTPEPAKKTSRRASKPRTPRRKNTAAEKGDQDDDAKPATPRSAARRIERRPAPAAGAPHLAAAVPGSAARRIERRPAPPAAPVPSPAVGPTTRTDAARITHQPDPHHIHDHSHEEIHHHGHLRRRHHRRLVRKDHHRRHAGHPARAPRSTRPADRLRPPGHRHNVARHRTRPWTADRRRHADRAHLARRRHRCGPPRRRARGSPCRPQHPRHRRRRPRP